MAARVTDKDKGYRKLVREVFGWKRPSITVGIHSEEGGASHGEGVSVLDVAIWNEFGTNRIPERSFIRAGMDEIGPEAYKKAGMLLAQVVRGRLSKDQALEQLGAWLVGMLQKRIAQGIPPENAPRTVAQKGSSKPLIDTGQLRSSITYKVKDT